MNNRGSFLRMARAQGKVAGRLDSELEATFEQHARSAKLPPWERNYLFLPGTKKEIDFAWPEWKFGVEIDGAVHRIKERARGDYRKHLEGLMAGWTIARLDRALVISGEGVRFAEELLNRARWAIEGMPPQSRLSVRFGAGLSDDSEKEVGHG